MSLLNFLGGHNLQLKVTLLFLLFNACGTPATSPRQYYQANNLEDGAADTDARVSYRLPDRTALASEVSDIKQILNIWHITAWTKNTDCPESQRVEKVGLWTETGSISLNLSPQCDYRISLELGNGQQTEVQDLSITTIVYKNNEDFIIKGEQLTAKGQIYLDLAANLQPAGIELGFITEILYGRKTDQTAQSDASQIKFALEVKPFIDQNCLGCHSNNGSALPVLETYDQVKKAATRTNTRINDTSSPMPPNGLPQKIDRDVFKQWMNDGYPL